MKTIVLLMAGLILYSCAEEVTDKKGTTMFNYQLQKEITDVVAGHPIVMHFNGELKDQLYLQLTSSWGKALLSPEKETEHILFKIPQHLNRRAGLCQWVLLANHKPALKGQFTITPKIEEKSTLETYFGPRSITAGDTDFSMLVSVVTDPYDNPWPDHTPVTFKSQFLDVINQDAIPSTDFISWKKIFATPKSGRILVTNNHLNTASKELTTIVFPGLATGFTIQAVQNHKYADGNQILHFNSGLITDTYVASFRKRHLANYSLYYRGREKQ